MSAATEAQKRATQAYKERNREKVREYNRRYREAHREEQRAYSTEYHAAHQAQERAYREEHREDALARVKEWDAANPGESLKRVTKRRQEVAGFLRDYKEGRPCEDCGKVDVSRWMHFHHRDPSTKSFDIMRAGTRSDKAILAEAEKCDYLCHACHLDRHAALRR